ncbi:U5 small nuclear ribonucleoprotein 40 kDa protein-like [Senna tora]|uniref:U5 small nuclear ribonucleoprotein 40 kDa protein-like n=1 Tax=Senna tora TaxID=362788 RepID=A0A835CBL9_9FABA|nr:U5 small nuclear ribonucleoprotein 40 kDa protein-like [Senna tora]
MEQNGANDVNGGSTSREEQEEALVALIDHRTREVKNLRQRISYYTSQLEEAEKRLQDSESKLARLRGQANVVSSRSSLGEGTKTVKKERSDSPIPKNEGSSKSQHQSKPELLIPSVSPKISQPILLPGSSTKASVNSSSQASPSVSTHSITGSKMKTNKSIRPSTQQEDIKTKEKGTKRKFEQKEHKELIPLIRTNSSARLIHCQTSSHISSQHKRKLRSLALCPVNDQLFVTSSLDGVVNLWQVQARGSGASLLSSTDCASSKQRRWPEDIAWHPEGSSLFSVYSADGGDSQISVLDLNKKQRERVNYLEDKPHVKGIINNIVFMPWEDICFVTGGSDHAVMLWSEKEGENKWKPKALHRNLHSSAVMGVAGLQQKRIVLSVGADKRIFGYDAHVGRADFRHQIDSKCMSVLPNPCDFNLFMVQTGTPERQLRLYDIRLRHTELHAFGWKQESSDSQSALINQAWSPDGLYITSGSADPTIHIFDIRYNAHKPPQSIRAHQKRVFKAVWLQSIPLLISISSDLNIELHKIM